VTEQPDDESADLDLKVRGLARTCRHVIPFAGVLDASNRARTAKGSHCRRKPDRDNPLDGASAQRSEITLRAGTT